MLRYLTVIVRDIVPVSGFVALSVGLGCISTVSAELEVLGQVRSVDKLTFSDEFQKRAVGLGSGLALANYNDQKSGLSAYEFWAVSDRGPNIKGPEVADGDRLLMSKIFPVPEYGPRLALLGIEQNGEGLNELVIRKEIVLKDGNRQPLGGLPPSVSESATGPKREYELALTTTFQRADLKSKGVDTEGVVPLPDGSFWLVEEYRPAVFRSDAKGRVREFLMPGSGLPEWLAEAQLNRGFEAITLLPNGDVVVGLQSPRVDSNGQALPFIDILRLAADGTFKQAYRFNLPVEFVQESGEVKVGDFTTIGDDAILASVSWKKQAYLMRLTLIPGQDQVSWEAVLNLRSLGWHKEKTEGVVLLPDGKSVVIVNDDDFEVEGVVSMRPEDLILRSDGQLQSNGKVTFSLVEAKKKRKKSKAALEMWIIELQDKL